MTFSIRIISDPLAGQRIRLPLGEVRIGGEEADIDADLETGVGAALDVRDDAVVLMSESPCWVDGRPFGHGQPLPVGQAIDLAGFAFVLGTGDAPIRLLAVPARRRAARKRGTPRGAIVSTFIAGSVALGVAAWQAFHRPAPATGTTASVAASAAGDKPDRQQGGRQGSGAVADPARAWLADELKKNSMAAFASIGRPAGASSWRGIASRLRRWLRCIGPCNTGNGLLMPT